MKTTGWSMALPAAVLVGLLVGAVPRAEAAVRTTAAAGNWNDTATWVDGGTLGLPVAGDTVVVNHAVTLDATTPELAAFTNNATLTFDGWNSALRATTIALGGTVTHLVNSDESGTPGVYESWTPDNRVLIEGHDITVTGTINADHMGYKGTRNSAAPRGPGAVVGQHGAGHGGRGASQWGLSGGGGTYGSALAPIDPGSGSGVSNTGGNGGGAVRIVATGRVTVTGTITANGQRGSSSWGCRGSGGSVYITCETFAGTGTIRANGGEHNGEEHAGGGGGRVAVVYDTTAQASVSPKPTVTLSAGGGRGRYFTRSQMGDPGTVHVSDTSFFPKTTIDLNEGFVPVIDGFTAWSPDSLTINNAWVKFPDGFALTPTNTLTVSGDVGRLDVSSNAVIRCASLNVTGGGQLWLYSAATNGVAPDYGVKLDVADTITVANNSSIFPASHPINGGSPILIAKDVDVQSGGTISANSLGFGFNYGPGSYSMLDPAVRASGAGHGGHGGSSTYGVMAPGATYGSLEQPLLPGSGGARPSSGAGGGLIRIEAWGTVTVNGNLTANGGNFAASHGSGGSGGAIFIQCREITGSAALSARGGNFCGQSGNGGGGGRIAVWFHNDTFTGSSPDVSAGAAASGRSHDPQPGTVHWAVIPTPAISNAPATEISYLSATLNGVLVSTGLASTVVSVYWGPTDQGTNANLWAGTNTFPGFLAADATPSTNITGLADGAFYFYRFHASNSYGAAWAPLAQMFQTKVGVPAVSNMVYGATNVTTGSAWLNGYLNSTGTAPTEVAVMWGGNDGGTNWSAWANANWFPGHPAIGPLTTNVTLATPDTTYYYTFFATNAVGGVWADSPRHFINGAITIEATDPVAKERGTNRTGTFTVTRPEAATNLPVTVFYTISGTAENGVDYELLPGSVVIPAGQTSATITVTPIADDIYDPDETVTLTLASGAYAIGLPDSATVTIEDSPPGLVISAAAGNWNTETTWGAYGLPGVGDTVVVNHAVTLDATTPELAAFTNNGTLTFNGWNSALRATTIALGGTVTHLVNSDESGTPGVYESWTPDNRVLIEGHDITVTGTINADHKGYKGTASSAAPRGPGAPAGAHAAGHGGRGAGHGGYSAGGGTYGSALAPIDPGSGAGDHNPGGNGGGAVRIVATGRVTVTGTITANGQGGGSSHGSRGSGGSVYITCETFAGTGTIRANGGEHNGERHAGGGGGRVAVVYDLTAQASVSPKPTVTLSAGGGRGRYLTWWYMGDPGTVHVSDTSFFPKTTISHGFVPVIEGFTEWAPDSLTVNNAWVKFPDGFALTPTNALTVNGSVGQLEVSSNAVIRCANLNVTGGAHLWLRSAATNGVAPDYGVKLEVADTITVSGSVTADGRTRRSTILPASHPINGGSPIILAKNVNVHSGGTISADSLGFGFNYGPGSYSMLDPAVRASGAGHGGHGGSSTYGVMAPGATYGSLEQPLLPGSGGARPSSGAGGGLIRIEAWGTVTVNGNLTANGGNFAASHGSGGSGGAIFIQCRAITGSATLSARGGNFCGQSGNSGGGGRIAVWFRQDTFTGSSPDVSAGAAAAGRSHDPQPGTVYWYEIPPAGTVIMLR